MMVTIARYYGTRERMLSLFQKITNQVYLDANLFEAHRLLCHAA